MRNAKEGKPAYMLIKMNSLVDREMITKLYQASEKGVQIKMIVRGICSLVPGVEGVSANISILSIVDKYLEHSRIFIFCNGGDEKCYISSGDWMYRNLDARSEVAVPIYNKEIHEQLKQYIMIQFRDNTKARIIDQLQQNNYVQPDNTGKLHRAQDEIYHWYLAESTKKKPRPEAGGSGIRNAEKPLVI
jgi:polyphosphate kinase